MVKIYESTYGGWNKCLFIENEIVQLVVTLEVGPRIIRYALQNNENMLCEVKEQMGTTGGDSWKIYGGHRLWHAPEHKPRTYINDNFPVKYTVDGNSVTVTPEPEEISRTQKEMVITLSENSSKVIIEHRITNTGAWDIDLALWALTVLDKGGLEVLGEPEKYRALLPNRRVSLWPYSKMNDHRVYWGDKYITLNFDPEVKEPFKMGIDNQSGWAAFFNKGCMFIKRYPVEPEVEYTDFGVSFETYVCDYMTECESLSPLMRLTPGSMGVHVEEWELFKEERPEAKDEDAIKKIMDKYV